MTHLTGSTAARNDDRLARDPAPSYLDGRSIAQIEADIRARERRTVAWIKAEPWIAGGDLADIIGECRRAHTESIARERADRASRQGDN